MDREKVLDKIRKCLALSESSTGNEAAVALRQAQALMARHGLNDEQVKLAQVVSATARAGWGVSAPRYMVALVSLIERTFGVIAVFRQQGVRTTEVTYFGIGCQSEVAAYVSDVLRRQLRRDRLTYIGTLKRFKRANKSRRADLYAEAWVYAASETVQTFVQDETVVSMICRGISAQMGELENMGVRDRRYQDRDRSAVVAGVRDGKNARLHKAAGFESRLALGKLS